MLAATLTRRLVVPALLAAGLLAGCDARAATVAEQIDAVVRAETASGKFSGDILVVRKGETLYRKSFGLADRKAGRANTDDSRFLVASVSKPFTAVLVMQLVEEGKLAVTDRLDAIFPVLAGKPAGAITLGQLLSHTSGIEEVMERHLTAPLTAADLTDAKVTAPGKYKYSSSAYVVLKLVVDKVGGQAYAARLQEKILDPAGMTASSLLRQGQALPGLSLGYKNLKDAEPTTPSWPIQLFDGAGSLVTTTDDLVRFDAALTSGKLLTPATQKIMNANHTEGGAPWAYGWALGEQGGKLFPWHKGDINGYTAAFVRQIHRGEVIVILSNIEGADITPLRQKVLRVLKDAASG